MAYVQIVPKQLRGPATGIRSGWRTVPGSTKRVGIRALMDAADIQDPALVIPFQIFGSFDGGATEYPLAGSTWHGGMQDRSGNFVAPYVTVGTVPMPTHLCAQADLPRAFQLGVEADTSLA